MISALSLAAKAVAEGPASLAPPSFDGHGWLVVANLTVMSAATLIALMVLIYIAQMAVRERGSFPERTPLRVWRFIGSMVATGVMLRCGVEAANIWGWDPLRPAETARFLFAKRLIDPIAVCCGMAGLATFALSQPGMTEQLEKKPLPINMWQSPRILRNIVALSLCSLIAAVAVVSTR